MYTMYISCINPQFTVFFVFKVSRCNRNNTEGRETEIEIISTMEHV